MSQDLDGRNFSPRMWRTLAHRSPIVRIVLPLLSLCLPYPSLVTAASCVDGFKSVKCSRHADNDSGKLPAYPERGGVLSFSQFGTRAVRMTERGMFGDSSARHRHQYSRRQAWNADESLIDLSGGIVDASNHSVILHSLPLSSERNWSNTDPDLLYGIRYVPDPIELGAFNVRTGEYDTLYRFTEFKKCTIGESEGSVSNDNRYILLVCSKSGNDRTLVSYDMKKGVILGQLKARKDLNWASFTQSGRYVVVENNKRSTGMQEQLIRYSPDLRKSKVLTEDRNHGDLGINENGEDVFVMINRERLSYIVISTGERITLGIADKANPVGHGHVSCRSIHRPGWCFLSSYEGSFGAFRLGPGDSSSARNGEYTASANDVAAERADGQEQFEQWGYHYSSSNNYDAEPKASVSPSGKQAIFTTDWGGSRDINDFVVKPDVAR